MTAVIFQFIIIVVYFVKQVLAMMKPVKEISQQKEITLNNIIFNLSDKNTADVIGNDNAYGDIFIPQSINVESKNYFITNILNEAFKESKIKSISFPSNSKIKTIGRKALYNSTIESIIIPSTVNELQNGWCESTKNLVNVTFSGNNQNFWYFDEKFIYGKSSLSKGNYDLLIFSRRNIINAIIPSFTTEIGSYSFDSCTQLKKIEFLYNSELQVIEKNAFKNSSIESLSIPSNLKELKEGWCKSTKKLNNIIISPKNKHFIIFDDLFIFGKSSPENDTYDVLVFANRNIKRAIIPSFIRIINSYAFEYCDQLQSIEFSSDSNLEIIGKCAFSHSSIKKISFPSKLKEIHKKAFAFCHQLQEVEISGDSELQVIDKYAFQNSLINEVRIPVHIKQISGGTFQDCKKLKYVEIPENSKLQNKEQDAFQGKSISSSFLKLFENSLNNFDSNEIQTNSEFNSFDYDENNNKESIKEFDANDWFEHYMGFKESYESVKTNLFVEEYPDHSELINKINNKRYNCGHFQLRDVSSYKYLFQKDFVNKKKGHLHIIRGNGTKSSKLNIVDILQHQNNDDFEGATFLSCSNFNCLEFPDSECSADEGINNYATDSTQGPILQTATIASTIYRNYFVKHKKIQSKTNEIKYDESTCNYFIGMNSDSNVIYQEKDKSNCDRSKIIEGQINYEINLLERTPIPICHGKAILNSETKSITDSEPFKNFDFSNENAYLIGVHQNCQISTNRKHDLTFIDTLDQNKIVHQVFASTLSFDEYCSRTKENKEIMKNILKNMYKLSILAAWENSILFSNHRGANKCVLSLLGGFSFENPIDIIAQAINLNKDLILESGLDVYIVCFGDDSFVQVQKIIAKTIIETGGSIIDAR